MRDFRFAGIVPPTLRLTGKGGKQTAEHLEARASNTSARLQFPEHWNEADVRGVLYAQQGAVCGYCGCHLPRNDRGDVEHFRPKAFYWQLAYEHQNYLLSCSPCNRTRKRDKFPLLDEADGRALLFHPAVEPVEEFVAIAMDGSCLIESAVSLDGGMAARIGDVAKFFLWNIDPLLVRERRECLRDVVAALRRQDFEAVKKMASRYSPHSLVALAVLRATGHQGLIPTATEELRFFAEDRLQLFELARGQMPQLELELKWCFLALWRDSELADRAWLEGRLAALGAWEAVRELEG